MDRTDRHTGGGLDPQPDIQQEQILATALGVLRSEPVPAPSTALLNRILADAASVAVDRTSIEPVAPASSPRIARRWLAWLDGLGGLPGGAALASMAAAGFVAGLLQGDPLSASLPWTETLPGTGATAELVSFFDMATEEN